MTGSTLIVPSLERNPWPTLGPEVCDFIEAYLVHGPGDVLGDPIELTDEQRLFIYRAYEVHPRDHELAGRRRFKEVGLSRRKGWSKTELAAWLAITESHPEGPVRCDGWHKSGREWIPIGRPVRDPYIPMVAVTEEQTEDLAYGAVKAILQQETCVIAADFEAGEERTLVNRRGSRGEIKPLASAPSARDGARTTWQHFDEPHLFITERLRSAYRTMKRNIPKRKAADAWSLTTSTAFAPGEGSVQEELHLYAEQIAAGQADNADLYYDHLQASEAHDLSTDDGLRAAIIEASGDAVGYTDVEAIVSLFRNPKNPENESRRYWVNQPRANANRWMAPKTWEDAAEPKLAPDPGDRVTLGFWGDINRVSAGLVAVKITDGDPAGLAVIGSWEPRDGSRIAGSEVAAAMEEAMQTYDVAELVTSRTGGSGWINEIDEWDEMYPGTVVEIPINSPARMGPACDRFYTAIHEGHLFHDGHLTLARHAGNAVPAKSVHGTYIRPGAGEDQHITLLRAAVLAYERSVQVSDETGEFFAFTVRGAT